MSKNEPILRQLLDFYVKKLWSQPVFSILQFRALWSHFNFSLFLIYFFKKLFRFSFLDIFKNVHFQEFLKSLEIKCFFCDWKYFMILFTNNVIENGENIWHKYYVIIYAAKNTFSCPLFFIFCIFGHFSQKEMGFQLSFEPNK